MTSQRAREAAEKLFNETLGFAEFGSPLHYDTTMATLVSAFALIEAEALERGARVGIAEAARAYADDAMTWENLGPLKTAVVRKGVAAILALSPADVTKGLSDADT